MNHEHRSSEGILLVDKPKGKTAFDLVAILRRRLNVKTIGHAGTLDPMATGVMVMLIGKKYTTQSNQFLTEEKEYIGQVHLGIETDSYDAEGKEVSTSPIVPPEEQLMQALTTFQGEIQQIPPMFSAKKINGQKLCNLARQGKTVERQPVTLTVKTELISYAYPFIELRIICSKGTYVRSIAHDLGKLLGCGAHLSALVRTRSGSNSLSECIDGAGLYSGDISLLEIVNNLRTTPPK
ncbi:MAG: tRNA pseudouridine(55) synthase TruB [Parachlamydiaceae bacterium]|nr:tRNA pseudouridine(55) synthase TruB [Parachlamydiaceae bacterium]